MTHFYEKNIVEIKNEYTEFLTNIMTPLIYEGIRSMYNKAINYEEEYIKAAKQNPSIANPGVLKIFQAFLKDIPKLNSHIIENETARVRDTSKCADIFDDLIKAVVKSNIVLLTFNASGKQCKIVNERFHETVDTKIFIHKCYIECARLFYNYPELFWHGYSTLDIKRNQREAHRLIRIAVCEAIRKMLPIKSILEEYLKNDYIKHDDVQIDNDDNAQYENIKNMIQKDLHEQPDDNGRRIFMSSEEEKQEDNGLDELEKNVEGLEKMIKADENKIEENKVENEIKIEEPAHEIFEKKDDTEEEFKKRMDNINLDDLILNKKTGIKKTKSISVGVGGTPHETPKIDDMIPLENEIVKSKMYEKPIDGSHDRNVFFDAMLNR